MAEIKTIIQLKHDTAEKWATEAGQATPLKPGEAAVEIVDGKAKLKIGTSEDSTFGNSEYFGSDVKEAQVYQSEILSASNEEDDEDVIAALIPEGTEVQNGDIAIIRRYIVDGKGAISYTSYVYDSSYADESTGNSGWAATDGNYSASNVYLKNSIELAGSYTSVGNYEKGETIAAGTSLEALLSGMLQQELYPTASNPTAAIGVSGGSGEVGSSYTLPTATLTLTDVGSYTYGPDTGITVAIGDAELKQGSNSTTNSGVMVKGSTITLQATDTETLYTDTSKSYTFSATMSHSQGAIPVTNLGNEYEDARIAAGDITIANKTATFSGYRYIFGGGTSAATIDTTAIRALSKLKKTTDAVPTTSGGKGFVFSAAKGATKVIFAYPSTWTSKTPKFEIFTMAWGSTEGFEKSTVQVADATGTGGLKDYTVYTYTPATPLAADITNYCVYFA